jgi:multidrug efflux pump subunit AcrB
MSDSAHQKDPGPLAFMARNEVAANLILALTIIGGLVLLTTVGQEVFPEVSLDRIAVTVPYPGATPAEVEQGVVLAVEEAMRGIDGVKEVQSTAREGLGTVTAELYAEADEDRALSDVKNAIDRIVSFPDDAEEPSVSLLAPRLEVVSVILHGNAPPSALRALAEEVRGELLSSEQVTQVEISGLPPPQITVAVPVENLRRYNLTLEQVAARIRSASVEIPGGAIETPTGETLLRTTERRRSIEQFGAIAVIARDDGSRVTVGDIGDVYEDYEIQDLEAYYNGQPAVRVTAYRVGDETPITVSDAVHAYVDRKRAGLPPGVGITTWDDSSEIFEDRINLLLKNGFLGLLLVLIVLGLFLKLNHAFWVTVGMIASFCGAFIFMAAMDLTINMISLFAFILVLGIVVDDAIVVGEAAYNRTREGAPPLRAAIEGVREVGVAVVFSVLTTVVAFVPILFIPGVLGKLFAIIPLVVIPILLLSLTESLFVLPAHLGHHGKEPTHGLFGRINRLQDRISDTLERWVNQRYVPWLRRMLVYRNLTLATALGLLIVAVGTVAGGLVNVVFFPDIEGDEVVSTIELPFGSALGQTRAIMQGVVAAGRAVADSVAKSEGRPVLRGMYSEAGGARDEGGPVGLDLAGEAHRGFITASLVAPDQRAISAREFSALWRRKTGDVPGVERLAFEFNIGPSAGAALAIELSHEQEPLLKRAAERLAAAMGEYTGVFDIDDGFEVGKAQIDLALAPGARALGITEADLARQVRNAFFGAEALRQQRGREETRVYVRLPREQRGTEYSLQQLVIVTPEGGEIPLDQAAVITRGRSYTSIERVDGRRVAAVTADVNPSVSDADRIYEDLVQTVLPGLVSDHPGLTYGKAGEQQEMAEAISSLGSGMLLALLVMYGMMAVIFQSYVQPLIVLLSIPFGMIGAVAGHALLGYQLSLVSMLGLVALAGVVVNDSIVLLSTVNDTRREDTAPIDTIIAATSRRFRPVLLTSLTTFFGLAPIIMETSLQARFLIPMAISLGFGVLFATGITLVLAPAALLAVESVKRRTKPAGKRTRGNEEYQAA